MTDDPSCRVWVTGNKQQPRKAGTMKNEILNALRTFGWQPTSALSFAFGSEFAAVIKKLHNEGKVVKHRNGWKAA